MCRRLALATIAVVLTAASGWGQSEVKIPFAFHVGEVGLSAGNYEIIVHQPFAMMITINSQDTGKPVAVAYFYEDQPQSRTAPQAKLVFNKYGSNEYFLSQIWDPLHPNSMELPKSKREVVTSKLVAHLRPEKVVIVAAALRP